jgi:hypothetical protein
MADNMTPETPMELLPDTVARSVLKDCVGMSWDKNTVSLTMTPSAFVLCIQAVLARHVPKSMTGEQPDDVPGMDDEDCWKCGGEGSISGTCTCGDDTCCCAEPEEEICDICNGKC